MADSTNGTNSAERTRFTFAVLAEQVKEAAINAHNPELFIEFCASYENGKKLQLAAEKIASELLPGVVDIGNSVYYIRKRSEKVEKIHKDFSGLITRSKVLKSQLDSGELTEQEYTVQLLEAFKA